MTEFHDEVLTIRNHFVFGRITKVTAVVQFEALMHHYGLLPEDEEIDPTVSDVALISLLVSALSLTPESVKTIREHQAERKFFEQKSAVEGLADLFGSVQHTSTQSYQPQCPVCKKHVPHVYREITVNENEDEFGTTLNKPEVIKFDQLRCEKCAREYLEEHFFGTKRSYIPDTKMADMSLTERKFFRFYEEQMKDAR